MGILLTYKHVKNTLHVFPPSLVLFLKWSQCAVPARGRKMATHSLPTRVQTHFFQSLKHKPQFTLVSAFLSTNCPKSQESLLFSYRYLWFQIIQFRRSYTLDSIPFCSNHYNDLVVLLHLKLWVSWEAQPAVFLGSIRLKGVVSEMWVVEFLRSRKSFQKAQRYT